MYKKWLHKLCFQHDLANGQSKYPQNKTYVDKVLKENAFKITFHIKIK